MAGKEAADKAAKEAAGRDPNSRAQAQTPQEPDSLQIPMAATKSSIYKTMQYEWEKF